MLTRNQVAAEGADSVNLDPLVFADGASASMFCAGIPPNRSAVIATHVAPDRVARVVAMAAFQDVAEASHGSRRWQS